MKDEYSSSFKELEKLTLKATYDMEINGRQVSPGEIIARFDKIYASGFSELTEYVSANGGFDNRAHVFWETTKGLHLKFSQGIFSKSQFALMCNCGMISKDSNEIFLISEIEQIESDLEGHIQLKHEPYDQLFVYDRLTGERVHCVQEGSVLRIGTSYREVYVTYQYNYNSSVDCYQIGKKLLNGFVELEGRTRIKDDVSGQITTGIIKIPKLKLMSGLSIRLGSEANPVVASFAAEGVPIGDRRDSYVIEFSYLDQDLDSDM